MRRTRIYLDTPFQSASELTLDGSAAHHLLNVLRLRRGDSITLFDGHGQEAEAQILQAHRRNGCHVRVDQVRSINRESPLEIHLLQALARGDRFDMVVQKATELGVQTITPLLTERTERSLPSADKRLRRWREIIVSACGQCGRNHIPVINPPIALTDLTPQADCRLVSAPEAELRLAAVEPSGSAIELLIGPEGGLAPVELDWCSNHGFDRIGLGPRILRTETAGLAAIAALQALHGDG